MATTARELFALAADYAGAMPEGVESAEMAISALGYVGRALSRMPLDEHGVTDPSAPMIEQLATACRSTAMTWPPRTGRLPDLIGAATDLVGRQVDWGGEARWDVAVELAQAARRCVEVALRHHPYAQVPVLRWVHATAAGVELDAARRPPGRMPDDALDRPVPSNDLTDSECQVRRRVLEATACLLHAIRQERRDGGLHVDAALATVAVAERASQLCIKHRATSNRVAGVGRHVPEAWQIVYAALVRFDDGSRGPGRTPSTCVRLAMQLQQELQRSEPVIALGRPPGIGADLVSAIGGTVPMIARELDDAVLQWGESRAVFARARDLVRSDAMVPALLADAIVPVGQVELAPVARSLQVAARLSCALAIEIGSAGSRGVDHEALLSELQWVDRVATRVREFGTPPSPPRR